MSRTGIRGVDSLDALIKRIDGLADGPAYAQAAKTRTDAFLAEQLGAGLDPNTGKAFPPTLAGKKAMKSAPSQPKTRLAGLAVIVFLGGHYVYHLFASGRRVARRAIPQGSMPDKLGLAIRQGMVTVFRTKARGA